MSQNNCNSFWQKVRLVSSKTPPLSSTIDGRSGQGNIAEMWSDHYATLLNSVTNNSNEDYVKSWLNTQDNFDDFTQIKSIEILTATNSLSTGKAAGSDTLSSEHFKHASNRIHFLLAWSFSAMIHHAFLPEDLMKTMIVPLVKDKTGDITSKDNYSPIALSTVSSKIDHRMQKAMVKSTILARELQTAYH